MKRMVLLEKLVVEKNSCLVCHGEEGRGGVINPGSTTGMVPAWDGREFTSRIASRAILKEVILTGTNPTMKEDPRCLSNQKKERINCLPGKTLSRAGSFMRLSTISGVSERQGET